MIVVIVSTHVHSKTVSPRATTVNDSDPEGQVIVIDTVEVNGAFVNVTSLDPSTGNPGYYDFTTPTGGTVALNPITGDMIYSDPGGLPPGEEFNDSFRYTVKDSDGLPSEPATVAIVIEGGNNPPATSDDTTTVPEDEPSVSDCVL